MWHVEEKTKKESKASFISFDTLKRHMLLGEIPLCVSYVLSILRQMKMTPTVRIFQLQIVALFCQCNVFHWNKDLTASIKNRYISNEGSGMKKLSKFCNSAIQMCVKWLLASNQIGNVADKEKSKLVLIALCGFTCRVVLSVVVSSYEVSPKLKRI